MVTTTYLLVVLALGAGLWWWSARMRSSRPGGGGRPSASARLRSILAGAGSDEDLVERMATELAERTVVFGSSHAVPGHLGAELPVGVFEAAAASRPLLTQEVVQRYCALMDERGQRLGRTAFALPDRYGLHLALACGPEEILTAAFEPIVDVRAAAGIGARPLRPVPLAAASTTRRRRGGGLDEVTVRRAARAGRTVVLELAGAPLAQQVLGDSAPVLAIGRGTGVALQCPEDLEDVSRLHAELTWSDGRCHVVDRSANGTWLQRPDGTTVQLVPGEPTPWSPDETILLDEEHQVTASLR